MKGLLKAAREIAQVLGVITRNNVATASEGTFKHYPRLAFGS